MTAPQCRPRIPFTSILGGEKPRQERGSRVTERQAGSFRGAGTNTSM
jgi:hypothetical protein